MKKYKHSSVLIPLMLFVACSFQEPENIVYDLTTTPLIEEKSIVKTSPLQTSIKPVSAPNAEPVVLLLPIYMAQEIENSTQIAKSITWEIWNVMLNNEVFTSLQYDSSAKVTSLKEALQYAKSKKANILVTGVSNSFLDGGNIGTSTVALNLQFYDVATGNLLWSLHQSGELKAEEQQDFILFQRQKVLPKNPIGTIVATLTYNMVQPVKLWRISRPHFAAESF